MNKIETVVSTLQQFSNETTEELNNYIDLQGFDKPMGFMMMLNKGELSCVLSCLNNLNEGTLFEDTLKGKGYSVLGNKIIWTFLCKKLDFDSEDIFEILVSDNFDEIINLLYSKVFAVAMHKEGLATIEYDKDNEDLSKMSPIADKIKSFNYENVLR